MARGDGQGGGAEGQGDPREVAEREGRGETDDRAGGLRGAERRRGGVRIHREEAALSGRAPADHRGERERVTGMVRGWARTRMTSRVARAGEYRDQTFRRGTHAPFRSSPLRARASPGNAGMPSTPARNRRETGRSVGLPDLNISRLVRRHFRLTRRSRVQSRRLSGIAPRNARDS